MESTDQTKVERRHDAIRKITGALMFVMGLFWFAKKAGWIPADHAHSTLFWPALAIGVGLFIFFGAGRNKRHSA